MVIHDDLDVPVWRLKIVERGGPGGHKGVLSLIGALGTEEFIRVKLGIGRPAPEMPTENYVLTHFPAVEAETSPPWWSGPARRWPPWWSSGLTAAQNRFHSPPDNQGEKGKRGNGEKGEK